MPPLSVTPGPDWANSSASCAHAVFPTTRTTGQRPAPGSPTAVRCHEPRAVGEAAGAPRQPGARPTPVPWTVGQERPVVRGTSNCAFGPEPTRRLPPSTGAGDPADRSEVPSPPRTPGRPSDDHAEVPPMHGHQPTQHPHTSIESKEWLLTLGVPWDFPGTSNCINGYAHEAAERSFLQVTNPRPSIVAGHRAGWSLPGHLTSRTQ